MARMLQAPPHALLMHACEPAQSLDPLRVSAQECCCCSAAPKPTLSWRAAAGRTCASADARSSAPSQWCSCAARRRGVAVSSRKSACSKPAPPLPLAPASRARLCERGGWQVGMPAVARWSPVWRVAAAWRPGAQARRTPGRPPSACWRLWACRALGALHSTAATQGACTGPCLNPASSCALTQRQSRAVLWQLWHRKVSVHRVS
jgi:hypothetical protein